MRGCENAGDDEEGSLYGLSDVLDAHLEHRAASTRHSELCELLIEEGAEADAVDKAGQTPLMNAVICQHKEVAMLLIRHGADVDVVDKEGYTMLGRAPPDDFRKILIDAAQAMREG
ncbi:Ankyrin repeat domain-containing protein [Drosera capensis]